MASQEIYCFTDDFSREGVLACTWFPKWALICSCFCLTMLGFLRGGGFGSVSSSPWAVVFTCASKCQTVPFKYTFSVVFTGRNYSNDIKQHPVSYPETVFM